MVCQAATSKEVGGIHYEYLQPFTCSCLCSGSSRKACSMGCAPCGNCDSMGNYECSAGWIKDGIECTGKDFSDTQTCGPLVPPSENFTCDAVAVDDAGSCDQFCNGCI